jgi:hypothetical protein
MPKDGRKERRENIRSCHAHLFRPWLAGLYHQNAQDEGSGWKSPVFLMIVWTGYLCGIIHKLLNSPDWVIALYITNLVMITVDFILYWRFVKRSQPEAAGST